MSTLSPSTNHRVWTDVALLTSVTFFRSRFQLGEVGGVADSHMSPTPCPVGGETVASTDLTTLLVAVAGVAGTTAAPWLAQRAHRGEAREQAERDARVREEDRRDRAFERKRALYVELNRVARIYRSSARDVALTHLRGEGVSQDKLDALDRARNDFRMLQSEAQMALPTEALPAADEAGRCLALGYEHARRLAPENDGPHDPDVAIAYLTGPLSAAIRLRRHALRADLGVAEPVTDLRERLDHLAAERARYSDAIPAAQPRGGLDAP